MHGQTPGRSLKMLRLLRLITAMARRFFLGGRLPIVCSSALTSDQ